MKHHLLAIQDYANEKVEKIKSKGEPKGSPGKNAWEQPKGKAREAVKGGPKGPPGKLSDPVKGHRVSCQIRLRKQQRTS